MIELAHQPQQPTLKRKLFQPHITLLSPPCPSANAPVFPDPGAFFITLQHKIPMLPMPSPMDQLLAFAIVFLLGLICSLIQVAAVAVFIKDQANRPPFHDQ